MQIDRQWLERQCACPEGKEFFLAEGILLLDAGTRNLIKKEKLEWANWLVTRAMNHTQKVLYGVYAAKQVLRLYENIYPKDHRPRNAIQAALRFVKNPTKENEETAYAAYAAANAAANAAAYAANAAAYAAAYAAYAAANAAAYAAYAAANAAANAAYAAANAAANAAYAAYAAAYAANAAMKTKIILYGLRLIKKENKSYVKSDC